MSLTRLFVERPTLVTVFLALVLLAGLVAGFALVQQQFPSTDVPSIQVLLSYPGASTTEMRDAIVRPARRPDRRRARPRPPRDRDPAGASLDRRGLHASTRIRTTTSCRCKGRVQNAHAPASQRPQDAADLDLQSERSGRRLAARCARDRSRRATFVAVINKIVPAHRTGHRASRTFRRTATVTPSIQVNVNPRRSRRRASRSPTSSTRSPTTTSAPRRHPLLAQPRDQSRRARRHPERPDRRQFAARNVGRRAPLPRRPTLWSTAGRLLPHRRRGQRHRHLRDAARVRVLERRAVRHARHPEVGRHAAKSSPRRPC